MSRRRRSTSSKRSETRSMRGVISSRKGPYFALVVALLLTGYTYVRLKSLDRGCVVTGSGARDTDGYYAAPADFYNRPEAPSFSRARVAFTAVPDVFALAQLPAAVAVARGGDTPRIQGNSEGGAGSTMHYALQSSSGGGRLYSVDVPMLGADGSSSRDASAATKPPMPPKVGWAAGPKQDDDHLGSLHVDYCTAPPAPALGGDSVGGAPEAGGGSHPFGRRIDARGGGWGGAIPTGGRGGGVGGGGGSAESGALAVLLARPGTALLLAVNLLAAWRLSPFWERGDAGRGGGGGAVAAAAHAWRR